MRKILITFVFIFALLVLNYIFEPFVFEADPIKSTCDIQADKLVEAHNKLRGDTLIVDDRLVAYALHRHPEVVLNFEHDDFQEDASEWFPNLLIGENLAKLYCTEEATMQAWVNSPLHYKNIMNKRFDSIGIYSEGDYTVAIFGDLR